MNFRSSTALVVCLWPALVVGQLTDRTQAPNTANAGIAKSLQEEIGPGRGDVMTPGSSVYIIAAIPSDQYGAAGNCFSANLRTYRDRGPMKATAKAISTPTARLVQASPTVAHCVTGARRARPAWAVMSRHGLTAGMRLIYSDSVCARCSPMRSRRT